MSKWSLNQVCLTLFPWVIHKAEPRNGQGQRTLTARIYHYRNHWDINSNPGFAVVRRSRPLGNALCCSLELLSGPENL